MYHVMHTTYKRNMFLHELRNDTKFDALKYWYIVCPKQTSLFDTSILFILPNSTKFCTICNVRLSIITPPITHYKLSKMGTFLHCLTIYTCIDKQDWLWKVVTSSQLTKINWVFWKLTLWLAKQCYALFLPWSNPFNLINACVGHTLFLKIGTRFWNP